jgi:hypothetical protein
MATADYPYLTASEAMMNVVSDVLLAGYELKGVLVDAEFTSVTGPAGSPSGDDRGKLALRSLPHFPVGIIGRFRSSTRVQYQGNQLQAKKLAEQFKPGKACFYRRLRLYAKRLTVLVPEVGRLDLIVIWYPHSTGFSLSILVSTIRAGLQELISAFKARWGLEVMHRVLRQNLALAKCQCLAFAAQLRHLDFSIDALHRIRLRRQHDPGLSWKQAQALTAEQARNALLTELNPMAA